MTKITTYHGANLDPAYLARLEAEFYLPGEKVKLNPSSRYLDKRLATRRAQPIHNACELVIAETRLDEYGNVFYMFEDIKGSYNAKAFVSPNGFEHCYGTLITRNGQTWFIPITGKPEKPVIGWPRKIVAELTRSARFCFGIDDKENTAEAFFSNLEAKPSTGEFYVTHQNGNEWKVTYSSRTDISDTSAIGAAEQAISNYLKQELQN